MIFYYQFWVPSFMDTPISPPFLKVKTRTPGSRWRWMIPHKLHHVVDHFSAYGRHKGVGFFGKLMLLFDQKQLCQLWLLWCIVDVSVVGGFNPEKHDRQWGSSSSATGGIKVLRLIAEVGSSLRLCWAPRDWQSPEHGMSPLFWKYTSNTRSTCVRKWPISQFTANYCI